MIGAKSMSNIFQLSPRGNARGPNRIPAHRGKLDVITAAMLTGGASGGWGMTRAIKSRAAALRERPPSGDCGQSQRNEAGMARPASAA
jgi:hypothetical protein